MAQQIGSVTQSATATLSAAPSTGTPGITGVSGGYALGYAVRRRKRRRDEDMKIVAAILAMDQQRRRGQLRRA